MKIRYFCLCFLLLTLPPARAEYMQLPKYKFSPQASAVPMAISGPQAVIDRTSLVGIIDPSVTTPFAVFAIVKLGSADGPLPQKIDTMEPLSNSAIQRDGEGIRITVDDSVQGDLVIYMHWNSRFSAKLELNGIASSLQFSESSYVLGQEGRRSFHPVTSFGRFLLRYANLNMAPMPPQVQLANGEVLVRPNVARSHLRTSITHLTVNPACRCELQGAIRIKVGVDGEVLSATSTPEGDAADGLRRIVAGWKFKPFGSNDRPEAATILVGYKVSAAGDVELHW